MRRDRSDRLEGGPGGGNLLSAVNQGAEIVQGQTTAATVARVGFNYLVPYVVASVGYLRACREDELPTTDDA